MLKLRPRAPNDITQQANRVVVSVAEGSILTIDLTVRKYFVNFPMRPLGSVLPRLYVSGERESQHRHDRCCLQ